MSKFTLFGASRFVQPLAFGLGFGVVIAVCLGTAPGTLRLETVEAKRFHVVDRKGNVVAELGLPTLGEDLSNPALLFYDRDGNTIAHLQTPGKEPMLVLFGSESSAAILSFDADGPSLRLRDRRGMDIGNVPAK